MAKDIEPEDAWLRFFLGRLRLGLRDAKSPATASILREIITLAEERLERLETATQSGPPSAA
jgi:hypothetical protein